MSSSTDFETPNRHYSAHPAPARIFAVGHTFLQLPSSDVQALELSEILDVQLIRSLINDFYTISKIPTAVIDIHGKVLASTSWQRICTDFHRVNPDTSRNCFESNTQLTKGVRPGEYRMYKCKNQMWHVVTPLMVGEHHLGNIFSAQFFFEEEEPDWKLFQTQAAKYGFEEKAYGAALAEVPHLNRDTVRTGVAFMAKLAHIISELSFRNVQMTRLMEERKRTEEALIQSEKLASVGRMAATVAHEINNPLEAVTNCVYLIRKNPNLPPELKEYSDIAERELHRIAHIAQRTLGFYREHRKPAVTDIRTLIDEEVELYTPNFTRKDIRIKIEHNGSSSEIFGIAGEVRQVISNLIINAIDASQLSATVRVRTNRVSLHGVSYVRVTVADTGTGIPAANLSRIFEPFFTTKEALGNGLGLWVSKKIIERHKGRIRVRSVEGKGTVFSIFLPCLEEDYQI
ncbi:MAG: hypothetical protein CXZ00_11745 [Acidobacteria bacterium]|nr:MAG: hypothetical protein CXZ00_11745 [Acidobacteriota bacterium]